ncbi:hypothetical protein [Chryseobacterium sp. RU33C]|uniref:hypothetical protein n=1 Tax=Chryseobacterium sp. RU33C TaxID=1907398 RepID=UPI00097035A1|nr:hypothetical protein [Chryseobacterium sp. RU33C]
MMKKEVIHISTIPVTIKVIQVGEKKLSVSVFNQIPIDDAFFTKLSSDERINCFIGWVERETKYILYSLDGILLRFQINNELLTSSDWDYKRKQYQKKYKLKHKDFLLEIGNFLNNKNQIYIAI